MGCCEFDLCIMIDDILEILWLILEMMLFCIEVLVFEGFWMDSYFGVLG